jgi:diguanylate cyclase
MDSKDEATGGLVSNDDRISGKDVLEAAPDALVVVDRTGRIVQLNSPAEQLFGYTRAELLGQPVEVLVPERDRAAHQRHRASFQAEALRRPMGAGPELNGRRQDGTEFPVEISLSPLVTGRGTLVLAAIRDISARKRAEAERSHLLRERAIYAEISRLARHDPLTGLPNRILLHDRLGGAIASAGRRGCLLAVLFLDLDRFKQVNDSLGHSTGDRLLRAVADRLVATVRSSDVVSRQGGDEFVVLLSEIDHRDDAMLAASKIIGAVAGPHRVGTHDLHATASIGIAVYPGDGTDAETLIKNADIAMYYAKDHGRDSCEFFTEEMNTRLVERQALEASLRGALDRREFVLHYQPKVNLETRMMVGAEALIRWRHPTLGLVPPAQFVPVAEESGLIVPIGRWVLREACRQVREWQRAGLEPVPLAVNISGLEFRSKGFLDGVRSALSESALDPGLLEIELTESVLMESLGITSSVLAELKSMGLGLVVDDFGTGYSSLSYLMKFPIDGLKVDQSFVREINGEGTSIIPAVISMGRSLNQRVIAEGVETPKQLAFLEAQRCEEAQGFHFSRPLEAADFAALLAAA